MCTRPVALQQAEVWQEQEDDVFLRGTDVTGGGVAEGDAAVGSWTPWRSRRRAWCRQ
jgi:hypothetical protein